MYNESTRKIINVDKPNYSSIFWVKEYDDCLLKLSLFKNNTVFKVSGQTITLGAKTSDGLYEQTDGITINGNEVDIVLKNSIVSKKGKVEIDLNIKDADGQMTTASFYIVVGEKVLNDEAVEATNEFDTFTKTVEKIEEDYSGLRRVILDENQAANLQDQVNQTNAQLDNIIQNSKEVLVTDFLSWQECLDYCKVNKKVMRIPSGEYEITQTLYNEGVTIIGDGANSTIIRLNNCDGILLKPYGTQRPVQISDFSILTTSIPNGNEYELCGIRFEDRTDGQRSRGYKLESLYFENLGCAIHLSDCFRTTINKVNINNCFRALYIKGQVVQLTVSDVTSNCDCANNAVSSRYTKMIGIDVEGSSHSGTYEIPESIRFNNVSMAAHTTNFRCNDLLYCSVNQCDFDLSRETCVLLGAYDGTLSITNSWISTKSTSNDPIIKIGTADFLYKKLILENNNISVLVGGNTDKVGILFENDYKRGVIIRNNTIQSFTSINMKYGISCTRAKDVKILDNVIFETNDHSIYAPFIEGGDISGNQTTSIYISSNADQKYRCCNNEGTIIIEGTATRIRDYYTGVS